MEFSNLNSVLELKHDGSMLQDKEEDYEEDFEND